MWAMTSHSFVENPSVCSVLSTNVFVARCFNVVLFACCLPASRLAHHRHGKRDLGFRLNSVANVRSITNVRRPELFNIFLVSFPYTFISGSCGVKFFISRIDERGGSPLVLQVGSRTRSPETCVSTAQVAETHATTVRTRTTTTQGAYHIHCG